ncbi:NudC domain-containing protein 1 [Taenia solium]|eukprot:TsM_000552300 transcript=TsM_000552300 gene=TsM_000552300
MNVSILPNRDLLDPKFQSYKLSNESATIITTFENEGVDLKSLPIDDFSRLNIHLSSLHNCLFQDPFYPNHLYYVTTTWKVKGLIIPARREAFTSGQTVFSVPQKSLTESTPTYNTSLVLLSDYALLSNGSDDIYLLETGDRCSEVLPHWKMVFEHQADLASRSGYLVDATQVQTADGSVRIEYILLSVSRAGEEKSKVHIDWFAISQNLNEWSMSRHRRLCCSTFPDYIALEGDASSLTVRSAQPPIPILDTSNSDIRPPPKTNSPSEAVDVEENVSDACFTWTQSLPSMPEGDSTLLNVLIKLSDKYHISDPKTVVNVACKSCGLGDGHDANLVFHRLEVGVHTEEGDFQLCNARLFAPVRDSGTMWTYDRETNSIDVTIVKEEAGTWPRLFADLDEDRRLGVRYDEGSLPAAATDAPGEMMQSCFNVEQLEDVDMVNEEDEDDGVMQRIDGESLKVALRAEMVGHQMLYIAPTCVGSDGLSSPSRLLCTRYDVDGLLWAPQPHDTKHPWAHVATLQAFGYVLASKQNRRFIASPPLNLTDAPITVPFVAVADITRHLYVYWQPTKNSLTELRHRKSDDDSRPGSGVVHVAWQQVIALPDTEKIIGFAAVAGRPYAACVVATLGALYLVCLDEGEK